jgi:hypothetical protein
MKLDGGRMKWDGTVDQSDLYGRGDNAQAKVVVSRETPNWSGELRGALRWAIGCQAQLFHVKHVLVVAAARSTAEPDPGKERGINL